MNKYLLRSTILLVIVASLLLTSCTESFYSNSSSSSTEQQPLIEEPTVVTIKSMDDLNALFNQLQYLEDNWNNSGQSIPRITFSNINEAWVKVSPQLPVETKKSVFFRLMTPLILISNEHILQQRDVVKNEPLDSSQLSTIALKYRVIKNKETPLTEADRQTLLSRVDIIPASLALAQAAEESGWATSRFALEGNALFGQWDFSGNGMKPQQQRAHLGEYGVAQFDSPLDSVEAYMLNLNTNAAYNNLRELRKEMRINERQITGYELAGTLDKYSERGKAYISGLRLMIRYNKLEPVDEMQLLNDKFIHLLTN
ncbi:glucosaminidase [Psychromonas marina]|uniref:Glucosaminidase n=1 Tax=Psychromonas marina TaxID=88364 RepID=A0ABQ6E2H4_9GAMM|nr:glucosaminidase domain-containing protein [Psychromonas marina]GLS91400.1 glucosaminidase [Psychromonas marina]